MEENEIIPMYVWTDIILKTREWKHVDFTFSRLCVDIVCGLKVNCRQHNTVNVSGVSNSSQRPLAHMSRDHQVAREKSS